MCLSKSSNPFFSIIVPTYNRYKYLKRAIESVLSQDYANCEIIILDDHSTDETETYCHNVKRIYSNIRYVRNEMNLGMAANVFKGMQYVKGLYFAVLNDDDWYLPGFFEKTHAFYKEFPEMGYFAGQTILLDNQYQVIEIMPNYEKAFEAKEAFPEVFLEKFPFWLSMIFSSKVLDSVSINIQCSCFDADFILQVVDQFSGKVIKEPVAIFFCHDHSFSTQINKIFFASDFVDLYLRYSNQFCSKKAELKMLMRCIEFRLAEQALQICSLKKHSIKKILMILCRNSFSNRIFLLLLNVRRKLKSLLKKRKTNDSWNSNNYIQF